MGGERVSSSDLKYFRFVTEEDFSDFRKLAPFWSGNYREENNEVLRRIGSDMVFYLGGSIPIPDGLVNRCADCNGILTENRDFVSNRKGVMEIVLSRDCHGSCSDQRTVISKIMVPNNLVRYCNLMVIIRPNTPCNKVKAMLRSVHL